MDSLCKFHKYGYCKLKYECDKYHEKEECKEGVHCENIQICAFRHPKMCQRIVLDGFCKFGEICAYKHQTMNSQCMNKHDLHEDVMKLKVEVDTLKNTIKSIILLRKEGEILEQYVNNMKEDIKFLKNSNKELIEKIKHIEEEFTDESDEDSDSSPGSEFLAYNISKRQEEYKRNNSDHKKQQKKWE